MRTYVAIAVVAGLLASACAAPTSPAGASDEAVAAVARASADPGLAVEAAHAVNAFGVALYHAAGGNSNLVVSPASVALALAMARAGARAATAEQMDSVLRGFGSDANGAAANAFERSLEAANGTYRDADGHALAVVVRGANAAFAQRGYAFAPAYLETLAERFGAGVRLVEYRTNADQARQTINGWVGEQTDGHIPALIGPNVLDATTRLALVNALYLQAPWMWPFASDLTTGAPWTGLNGQVSTVPTMTGGGALRYAAGQGWTAVELPFLGDRLAFTIIEPTDFRAFDAYFDATLLDTITAQLAPREVASLYLPRFKIDAATDLADALARIGMPLAFDAERADFSDITSSERLFIAHVIHEATIDVNERGTEATAATAVAIAAGAAPAEPLTIHVDHPFVFVLRDRTTGAVLFLGRVTQP